MTNALISVIIPVYRVEEFLPRCMDSVTNQTYQNLEIILVDDGSPDRCGAICDAFAKQDPRVVVIHQENQGLSGARNTGIEVAKGDYITFVDSDDFLEKNAIEVLYRALAEHSADIAVCGTVFCDEQGNVLREARLEQTRVFRGKEQMYSLLTGNDIGTTAWGKLYHRDLLRDVRFPVGKYHEDVYTAYKLLHLSAATVVCDLAGYWYRQVASSITHEKFQPRHLHSVEGCTERLEFVRNHYPEYEKEAYCALVSSISKCYEKMILSGYRDAKQEKEFQTVIRQDCKTFLTISPNRKMTKLFVATCAVNMKLARVLYKLARKVC